MQRGTDSRETCSRHALGGVRMGTPALTTRGLKEADFVRIADFVDRSIKITEKVRAKWYLTGSHATRGASSRTLTPLNACWPLHPSGSSASCECAGVQRWVSRGRAGECEAWGRDGLLIGLLIGWLGVGV